MSDSPTAPQVPSTHLSRAVRVAGKVLRAVFILTLVVLTAHVASPQQETVWSVFEAPGDAARLAIGLLVCLWLVVHLFTPPKGTDPYRSWFYLGLFVVPLALISVIATW
jgi:hypothetical protein